MAMTRARDFFEAVYEASRDAESIGRQIRSHEARATSLGGGGFGERVSSTHDHDRMGGRVASMVDHKAVLKRREERDYALIDRACVVLYGPDQMTGGLARDKSPAWADALWWRYVAAAAWPAAAHALHFSERHVMRLCSDAMAWLERTGYAADVMDGTLD
jgi:hypothetical protein